MHSGPSICASTVEDLLTQRSLGSFSGLSAQPHHSSLSMAPPCYVKCVNSSSSQGSSAHPSPGLLPRAAKPSTPTYNLPHLHCQRQTPASALPGCLQESSFHHPHAEELFSSTQKPSWVVPWESVPPWKSQLSPSPWCWCPCCSLPPVCPLTQWLSHLPAHHGPVNHCTHKTGPQTPRKIPTSGSLLCEWQLNNAFPSLSCQETLV